MINGGVFSDLNSKEKNNHAHHFHLGLTSRCLTGIYWFFRWNIYIDKYMYINGQKWKRVSQKRIRKQSKWIKIVLNAADKEKFLLSKNCAFRINWWGWSLGNKPFHPLNFLLSNIINILLILNWVWRPALWPMDHNCPVAYEPHLLRGLWTTTALWPMDHTCPVAYEPHLPRGLWTTTGPWTTTGLWTTTALWPMDHTFPVAHEPELVTVSCSQSYQD